MPSLLDKASEDFRESFRVAGRGAVNNQYFAHDVLHDETVLSLHTRSFWPVSYTHLDVYKRQVHISQQLSLAVFNKNMMP